MSEAAKPPRKTSKSGWPNLLIEWGPVLIFFGVYKFYAPSGEDPIGVVSAAIHATGAFVLGAVIAAIASLLLYGRIARMLALSTLLIVGFGGLTLWLNDPDWIQIKPTAFYIFFGIVLLAGWLRGKGLLQWALQAAFEGLDEEGWLKLSRNWGFFFFALAALNEILRHFFNAANGNFGIWVSLKLWVFMPLSFLFTFTQLPMLLRHGLMAEAEDEVVENPPPE
jgi:intracellular septation protein